MVAETTKYQQQAPMPWLPLYRANQQSFQLPPDLNLVSIFEHSCAGFSQQTATHFLGKNTSFKELSSQVESCATGLMHMGVKKGMRVGIMLPNCPAYIVMFYALLKCGAVVVNLNPLYTAYELKQLVEELRIEMLVSTDLKKIYANVCKLMHSTPIEKLVVVPFAAQLPPLKSVLFRLLKAKELVKIQYGMAHHSYEALLKMGMECIKQTEFPRIHQDDVAVIQPTGGTTGVPKGAVLTHRSLAGNLEQISVFLSDMIRPGQETVLAVLPFFHIFALTAVMNLALRTGMKMVIHPRFDLQAVLKDLVCQEVTIFAGVPSIYNAILHGGKTKNKQLPFPHLRLCVAGGAPLPHSVQEAFRKKTGIEIYEGYGLTEASPVLTFNPPFAENKPGSVGIPLPLTEVVCMDIEGIGKILPVGETGEICARGPQLMQGYDQNGREIENMIKEGGWLHTGDIGYIDTAGYVHIVDRKKEMIISNGVNVYPRHIEEEIMAFPHVVEVAVLGMPHECKGEVAHAFVVTDKKAEVTEEQLLAFLHGRLSSLSLPEKILFREGLPKTLIGKIDKKQLRNEINQEQKQEGGL